MGMDVYGLRPTSERGRYFCRNLSGWDDLARYSIEIAPDVCAACKGWHYNDGDGLDAAGAAALADALQREVDSGELQVRAIKALALSGGELLDENDVFYDEDRTVENVVDFIGFLRESGGFEIW